MNIAKYLVCSLALLGAASSHAALIDLSAAAGGAQTCVDVNDGANVCNRTGDAGSVGSGTFPSFVGSPGGQPDQFFMYNTEGAIEAGNKVGNGQPDNRTVQVRNLGVELGFVVFALDINQINTDPNWFLTVDGISLYASVDGALTGYNAATNQLGGVDALWSLTAEDFIKLNYSLAAGSGNDVDMYLRLPVSLFSGLGLDTYLQLYSSFGGPVGAGGFPNNNCFEEWAYLRCADPDGCIPTTTVPEPGALALLGLGLLGLTLARNRRWRRVLPR